ncbi:MAG TPA: hypothetical protein VHP54_04900 [Caproiciproducens sp.]|nr:hypothetical protein [Caproiciproducens sp.]
MSLNNNHDNCDLVRVLAANLGRMVTIFTESGGCTGCGFTGLLVRVDNETVKLTTELPCAPSNPFGPFNHCCDHHNGRRNHCRGNEFGTSCVIPIDQIVSVCFNEI